MRTTLARRGIPTLAAAVLAVGLVAPPLHAQCADGSPPPCRGMARPVRMAAPDPRTWIVVPFANVSRDAQVEWLSNASVNLLYLDLSRWTDIRVIDDGRVTDLMQTLPAAQRDEQLGLNTGIALARRAGAGRLVMGDLVSGSSRTTVIAKVYDVTSGRRLRTVNEEIASRDSTMPAYARLAGKVVDAPLPSGASHDAVGTRSLDAYQEYHAGLQALNSWHVTEARRRFERALQIDSTFGLAHYRLSIAIGWDGGYQEPLREHADAAARFTAGLPARERGLIRGQQQFGHQEYTEACETFASLVAADSSDVEAWYQIGECSYHNAAATPTAADSSRWRFVGSWQAAYRAFNRTLELDPSMHLAFEHLVDMLTSDYRNKCLGDRCERRARATVLVRHDSVFADSAGEVSAPRQPFARNIVDDSIRLPRLALAQGYARRWVAGAPDEAEAHYQLGLVFRNLRRYADAAAEVGTARRLGHRSNPRALHASLIMRSDSQAIAAIPVAVRLVDSALREPAQPAHDTSEEEQNRVVGDALERVNFAGLLGSFQRIPEQSNTRPWYRMDGPHGYLRALAQLAAGVVPPTMERLVRALADSSDSTARYRAFRRNALSSVAILCWNLCPPTNPPVGVADSVLAFLARGDTAQARMALQSRDSMLAATERSYGWVSFIGSLALADAQIVLGDSAGALRSLDRVDRDWLRNGFFQLGLATPGDAWLIGRVWLMKADLLRASGRNDEARLYYRRVANLWSLGDADIQPLVQRARAAAGSP